MPDDKDNLELSLTSTLRETFVKSLQNLIDFYRLEDNEVEELISEARLFLKNSNDIRISEQVDVLFDDISDTDLSSIFETDLINGRDFLAYLWKAVNDTDDSMVTPFLTDKTKLSKSSRLCNKVVLPVDYKRERFIQLFYVQLIQRDSVDTDAKINATVLCNLLKKLSNLHPMIFITDCQDTLKMEVYHRFNQSIDQVFDEIAPDEKKPIYQSWIAFNEIQQQYVECLIDFESRRFVDDVVFIKSDLPTNGDPAWYYRPNLVKWMKSHGTSPISNREITYEDIATYTDYALNNQTSELSKFINDQLFNVACSLVSATYFRGISHQYNDFSRIEYPSILSQLGDLHATAIDLQARSHRPSREKVLLMIKQKISEFYSNECDASQELGYLKDQLSLVDRIDSLIVLYLRRYDITRLENESGVSVRVKEVLDIIMGLCDQIFTGLLSENNRSKDDKYKQYDHELSSFWMESDAYIHNFYHYERKLISIEQSTSTVSPLRDHALSQLKQKFYSDSFVIFPKDIPFSDLTTAIHEKACILELMYGQLIQIVGIDEVIDSLRKDVHNPLLFPKIHKCKTAWIAALNHLYKNITNHKLYDPQLHEDHTILFDLIDQVAEIKQLAVSHRANLPPQLLHHINTIETWATEVPPIIKEDRLGPEIMSQLFENLSHLRSIKEHLKFWKKVNLRLNHNPHGDNQTIQLLFSQVASRLLLYYSDKLTLRPDLSDLEKIIDLIEDFARYEQMSLSTFERQHRWTMCFCMFSRSVHQRFNEMMDKRHQGLLDQFTNYLQSQPPSNVSKDAQHLRKCLMELCDFQSTQDNQSTSKEDIHLHAMSITS